MSKLIHGKYVISFSICLILYTRIKQALLSTDNLKVLSTMYSALRHTAMNKSGQRVSVLTVTANRLICQASRVSCFRATSLYFHYYIL